MAQSAPVRNGDGVCKGQSFLTLIYPYNYFTRIYFVQLDRNYPEFCINSPIQGKEKPVKYNNEGMYTLTQYNFPKFFIPVLMFR